MLAKPMAKRMVFNSDIKEDFLNSYDDEGTRRNYLRIFTKTEPLESKLNKDLYEFDNEEMDKLLKSFDSRNRATLESYARYISSYLKWSVAQGYAVVNILEDLRPNDFLQFIIREEKYITPKYLNRLENLMENYQDAVISRLIFEGVGGRGFSEILNLKESDVDFDKNILTLTEDTPKGQNIRKLKVETHTIELIRGALNQRRYLKRNGNGVGRGSFLELRDNGYVVKTAVTNAETNEATGIDTLYRRLRTIEKELGLDSFKAKFIQRSGVINMASKLLKDYSDIDTKTLEKIAKRYKINTVHTMKSYVTEENLKEYRN